MIEIREAIPADTPAVSEIFQASYGSHYAYPQYYDVRELTKMLFSDDTLVLVAEDGETGRLAGTASVLLEVGAFGDLVGEFGRLAVHPDFRGCGIGKRLMEGRIERVQGRLHLGLVEPRLEHPFSQRITMGHGFAALGFLPHKTLFFDRRESCLLCGRYFGDALSLRRNHPHIIPDAYRLAELSLRNCGLDCDAIVDDSAAPYPHDDDFELDEMNAKGYATLLRFQRGRIHRREIFGPMRLHYGLFKLQARHSNYLLARRDGQIVGAVGFLADPAERSVRIFELISLSNGPIRFLLRKLLERCRREKVEYIEVGVSGYRPRMQRTLLELGFLPAAYVPAMVFHHVERLDVLTMVRLLVVPDFSGVTGIPSTQPMIDLVSRNFEYHEVLPQIVKAAPSIPLLADFNSEQVKQLAKLSILRKFAPGQVIVAEGETDHAMYLVLRGRVRISADGCGRLLATLEAGQCVGEMCLLQGTPHSATAIAEETVQVAELPHAKLQQLIRRRPDIGVLLFRNLARGLGEKLLRAAALHVDG